MIDAPRILLIAPLAALLGWASFARADNDVTVVSSSTTTPASSKKTTDTNPDGTPVVHKSSHKKKSTQTAADSSATAPTGTASLPLTHTSTGFTSTMPHPVQFPPVGRYLPPAPANMLPSRPASATTSTGSHTPMVETGLPKALPGVSTYQPPVHTYIASNVATGAATTLATTAVATYTVPDRPTPPPLSDFNFVTPKAIHNIYPWRTYILTTEFWIGEGSTPISSTTNVQSSWDEEWMQKNHGTDNPYDRNGYAAGGHASTLNPFYCALPFNDLAFPDKAQNWLPHGWYRRPIEGKQVSACQHRWVEIKNSRGDICFAQWEDVGPLTYDDAEYVFGGARPRGLGSDQAGLDVSPAVYEYLHLSDRNRFTAWKFADESDVRPGAWLKLDEQAVIFTALEQLKNHPLSSAPIQRNSEPIDDPLLQSNKKKVQNAN